MISISVSGVILRSLFLTRMGYNLILLLYYNHKSRISGWIRPVALHLYNNTSTPTLNSHAVTTPPVVGFGTQPFGIAAISTSCGLNEPVER